MPDKKPERTSLTLWSHEKINQSEQSIKDEYLFWTKENADIRNTDECPDRIQSISKLEAQKAKDLLIKKEKKSNPDEHQVRVDFAYWTATNENIRQTKQCPNKIQTVSTELAEKMKHEKPKKSPRRNKKR